VLIDAHDPTLGRYRVHDPNTVLVKQRIKLRAQRAEAARLHLDQLAVARTRSITKRPTGSSKRSPGRANTALSAACSNPSRITPMLDTASQAKTGHRHLHGSTIAKPRPSPSRSSRQPFARRRDLRAADRRGRSA
jgi:hypothetical protein